MCPCQKHCVGLWRWLSGTLVHTRPWVQYAHTLKKKKKKQGTHFHTRSWSPHWYTYFFFLNLGWAGVCGGCVGAGVCCLHVYVCLTCMSSALQRPERVCDRLELELQMVESCQELRTEARSSGRAARACNPCLNSLAPGTGSLPEPGARHCGEAGWSELLTSICLWGLWEHNCSSEIFAKKPQVPE